MKKQYIIISLLLIVFLSFGSVYATDAISDDALSEDTEDILENIDETVISEENILETANENILSEGEETSFTQLSLDINNSAEILEITHDYKFNNDTDDSYGIRIQKDNFVINGNNHVIDGNNLSAIFIIDGKNITLNNLILKNANSWEGSAIYINPFQTLTTNNVTFVNNTAYNGIVQVMAGAYVSNNDKFLDSTAPEGVILCIGNVTFNNTVMRSSKELKWGFIASKGTSYIRILNSIFENTTSKYCTVIKGQGKIEFENCKFMNLYAYLTAGAIALREFQTATIRNCTFSNVTSEKNGGAIYVDAYTGDKTPILVEIFDSNFVDCHSQFGGAILQLEGYLNIDNCNFTNNAALFDGGAVYTSWTYINITNSKFEDNEVLYNETRGSFGGAIYSDSSLLTLKNSEFLNNTAQYGGAVYLYDGDYDIENNTFENNTDLNGNYNDIYTIFDGRTLCIFSNNNLSGIDSVSFNNEIYDSIFAIPGMNITIIDNSIEVDSIPSRFDLRDWGWVTPVKDQGDSGACWSFSSAGTMEAAILRYLGMVMDVSENNILDVSLKYSRYGVINAHEGASFEIGANYALSWFGVFPSEYDSYDELGKISPVIAVDSSIHIQDIVMIKGINNASDIDYVKKAILKYGALSVSYYAAQEAPYYNSKTSAQYCDNESVKSDHAIVLIGWDDSFSKENFLITPPGDGAWIFKNSWGDDIGDGGYFYISYYDSTFLKSDSYAVVFENDIIYNKNYQYDLQGRFVYVPYAEYRNNFIAIDDDLIAGVGTYFNDTGVEYTVEIYVNNQLRHAQNGLSPFAGYHTIKLDSYIPIKKGDEFTVKIKSNTLPALAYQRQHFAPGVSEVLNNGEWENSTVSGFICCIKAYTVADDTKIINNNNIAVDYSGGKYFSVNVVTADGHAVAAGAEVKFTINGKTSTVKTDSSGIAKIKITDLPGKYTITTSYNGKTYKNTVTVKQVLKASKVTVKKTAKKFTLKATLKINGKAVKGKWIKFKFNGKTYKAKTNAKGIAQKTLNKKVIKKLKKGKTYTVKVTYLKDTIKTTVKVK